MRYLITGGCGFLGANIASEILKLGHELIVFDNLSRNGSNENLIWLKTFGDFKFIHGDIRNINDVEKLIKIYKPEVIYHLAGQVAMTSSVVDPRLDFEINTIGSFNLLNSVRLFSPYSTIIYSSSNKVYGDLNQFNYKETDLRYECINMPLGFDENVNLNFHSPYGNSKGSADQYMLDFHRIYGLNTVVFRHSSMYGGRQFSTFDQGWIGWFTQKAIEIKYKTLKEDLSISGNGKQVRDLLYASDCVRLYLKASENIQNIKGQAFNVGGGFDNSTSILELFKLLEMNLDINMNYNILPPRESDQLVFISNISKAEKMIGWSPEVNKIDGLKKMIEWVLEINK